jgi:serine/threonine-protein kinase RsbT
MPDESRVLIQAEVDIVSARQRGRALAARLGFSGGEQALIATAISEIARNMLMYARRGEIVLSLAQQAGKRGMVVVARDEGPGIPDIEEALRDGYSTSRGLGLGLPGARRLTDEFEIVSEVGKGTTVMMKKWVR